MTVRRRAAGRAFLTALCLGVLAAGIVAPGLAARALARGGARMPMMPPEMSPMPSMTGAPGPTATAPGVPSASARAPRPGRLEPIVQVLSALVIGLGAYVAYRALVRRRRAVRAAQEAVLVVDLVDSTHVATHYGDTLAMRARNALKDRALDVARAHGLAFAESTGDGWFMTFPLVSAAVETATGLLRTLRENPPDLAPAPALEARAAITYGEILSDGRGGRHGATINKAFRLIGVGAESFAQVEGAGPGPVIVPDRNRILLGEEAAQELGAVGAPRRFVGFCRLKGFSGLHGVYELQWEARARGSAS